MIRNAARPLAAAWLLVAFAFVPFSFGQDRDKGADEPALDATRLDPLTEKEAIIRDRVQRLEDKMFELSKALEKAEPQNAAKLRDTLAASRSKQIRIKVENIIEQLGKSRYSDALDGQKVVITDFQQLLKMLMEDANKLEERKKEIERLEAFRKDLEKIIEEQRAEKARADAATAEAKRAESLEAAAQKAKELLQRQKEATAKSGQAAPNAEGLSKEQGGIRKDTQELKEDVDKLSGTPSDEAARSTETPQSKEEPNAQGTPKAKEAEDSEAEPKEPAGKSAEGAPQDSQSPQGGTPSAGEQTPSEGSPSGESKGEQAKSPSEGQQGAESESSSGEQQGGQSPSENRSEASKNLKQAGEKMKSAEGKLDQGQPEAAKPEQKVAEQELQKAIDELEKEAKQIRNKLKLDEQAEQQKKTADKTRDLGQRMKGEQKDSKGGKQGDQQGGQQGGKQGDQQNGKKGEQQGDQQQQEPGDPNQQPTPGQEDVEGAVPFQDDAEKELKDEDPEDAAKKQEEALKKLEQAKEQLEDVLEQLRREQQEELLAALEARFRAMLGAQLEVNKGTLRLSEMGKSNWKRSDQLELAELAEKQRWVGTEADKTLKILEEEGSTVVFPQVVEQVRDDALDTGEKLATADTGRQVQLTQAEIEVALRELIEAVKKMQEENQNGGGGGGGGGGNDPLLPGSAELKLLRACQIRVNNWTKEIEIDRVRPDVGVQDIDGRMIKLQKRQDHVDKMARAMRDSLNKAQ